MPAPILATKLYVPPAQPGAVPRPRLIERLDEGLQRRLTLISAAAGFGKTTLLGEWIAGIGRPAAWLLLGEWDSDPARFLAYLVAALRTIDVGEGVPGMLDSPHPPPTEGILTVLINELAAVPDDFVLVLDDYHVIDAEAVDDALAFLLEHLPPQVHLVIATREDPRLPLARLSGPLCDAVADQEESVALLGALERGNLFVVPLVELAVPAMRRSRQEATLLGWLQALPVTGSPSFVGEALPVWNGAYVTTPG
jgi:ATP/maltotriose-dependent transcriptional regulator MalT